MNINIKAVTDGVIDRVYINDDLAGNCVVIESNLVDPVSGNKLKFVYMHLRDQPAAFDNNGKVIKYLTNADRGRKVVKGDVLGITGSTGNSGAEHLHFEVINHGGTWSDQLNYGTRINPTYFYPNINFVVRPGCELITDKKVKLEHALEWEEGYPNYSKYRGEVYQ